MYLDENQPTTSTTPGHGLPLFRFWLLSIATAGTGMQDAVLVVFLLETLMRFGASRFLAFLPIALGGLISIPLAAITNSVGARSVRLRQVTSLTMLYIAALFNVGLAFSLRENRQHSTHNILLSIFFATGYRAASQSSPIVPMLHDSARVFGSEEKQMRRRLIATATLYCWYRLGFGLVAIVIAIVSDRLFSLFIILLSATTCAFLFITISTIATHGDPTIDKQNASQPPLPFAIAVREHFDAAFLRADKRLVASYMETIAYGLAFGQLGAVRASFFNEQIFNVKCGSTIGLRWAAYSTLIYFAVNLLFEAILPVCVFHKSRQDVMMPLLWTAGSIFGSLTFFALKWVRSRVPAMLLFGTLAITTSTHNMFSLLAAGGYVEPKLRGTVFGVRAACSSIGVFIGAFVGGNISMMSKGFDYVMLFCALAVAVSGIAAAFGGSVSYESVDGVTVNANPLMHYLFRG